MKNTAIDFNAGIDWLERRGFHFHCFDDKDKNKEYTLVWKSKKKYARKVNEFQTLHEEAMTAHIIINVVRKADDLYGKVGFYAHAFWMNHDHTKHGGSAYGNETAYDNVVDALLSIRDTIDECVLRIEEVDYKRKRTHTDCIKSEKKWLDAVFPAFQDWYVDGKKFLASQGYKEYHLHGFVGIVCKSKDRRAECTVTLRDVRKSFTNGKAGWRPSAYYGEVDEPRGRGFYQKHQIFSNVHDALKSVEKFLAKGKAFIDRYDKKHSNKRRK